MFRANLHTTSSKVILLLCCGVLLSALPLSAQVIWQENFSYPNGTDLGGNNNTANPDDDWTSQCPNCTTGDWFEVRGNRLEGRDVNGPATLVTESIDISAFPQGVEVLVDLDKEGSMEGCPGGLSSGCNSVDWIQIEFSLDGAPYDDWTSPNGGTCLGNCAGADYVTIGNFDPFTLKQCPIFGDSLRLRISVQCWANTETFFLDNLIVQAQSCSVHPPTDSLVPVLCRGGSDGEIWIFSENPNLPLSYSLDGGPFQAANSFIGLSAGTYTVTVRDSLGNQDILSGIVLPEPPGPIVELGNDTLICEIDSLTLNAEFPGLEVLWSTGDTTSSITVNSSGTYAVEVTDLNNCRVRDSLRVLFTSPPVIDLGPDRLLCDQATFPLDADPFNQYPGATFAWNTGANTSFLSASASGSYQVLVEYGRGCIDQDTIVLEFANTPQVDLGPDAFVCAGTDFQLDADPLDQFPTATFNWNTSDQSPVLEIQATGAYQVRIENVCGVAEDSIYIEVNESNPNVFIPNAFSPNQDGLNETFVPVTAAPIAGYHLMIFDRWGKTVFESRDPGQAWDGDFRGQPLPPGVYMYVLKARNCDGNLGARRGTVSLLR